MPQKMITETAPLPAAQSAAKSGRLALNVITPGEGSSGYYTADVLKNAVGDRVWPAGTKVYFDHPTEADTYARPERTVRDLVAVLTEDATWDEQAQAVVSQMQPFAPYVPLMTDPAFVAAVGMSIRAMAESRHGQVGDYKGTVITKLLPSPHNSVDVVTVPGRGGAITAVLESLRPPIEHVSEMSARDSDRALSDALREMYGGEKTYVWLRDHDPDLGVCWYSYETPNETGLYQEGYAIDDQGAVTLSGDPIEVRAKTVYVPVAPQVGESDTPDVPVGPAGQPQPTKEIPMGQIQVDEAEHGRLAEAAGRVPALETERDQAVQRAKAAEARLAESAAAIRSARAGQLIDAVQGVTFTALERRGLLADIPATEAGDLDEAALQARIDEAAAVKAAESGSGQVKGFGQAATTDTVTEADEAKTRAALFGRAIKE